MYILKVVGQQLIYTYFLRLGGNMKDLKNVNMDETEILYKGNKIIEERKIND